MIFIGPPGAGKGTQAARISEKYELAWISTGDMFRAAIAAETPMGQKAKEFVDSGALVPDDVVVGMTLERIAEPDCETGYLLDGFPRTVPQAEALDAALGDDGIDLVLHLDVDREELVQRLLKRAQQEGRKDDTPDTVRTRLEVYSDETAPVLGHYRPLEVVADVDGLGSVDEVFERLVAAIEAAT